jgi:MoaA/NifB/PqqE/SkfB family radical SAM enzyme
MSDKLPYLIQEPKKYIFDGCKMLWHQDRLEAFLRGERIMPIHIDMGIHKACNIKCVYCYGVKQGKTAEYIPEDRLLLVAEDAGNYGIKSIAIIGDGEPTMNKGLYPFVQALYDNGVDCSVATNGLLLDWKKIQLLTKCCTWLRFNISGVDKYDWVMGASQGSLVKFEEVIKDAVSLGKCNGCTIGLQMVLIPDCFSEAIPLAKKAIEWGVDYLVIKQFSDGGSGMPIHIDMDKYKEVFNELVQAEAMSTKDTQIIVKWSAIKDTTTITGNKHWDFDRCIDLPFIFQISGNGNCYPCGYHFGNDKFCYGNINNERLYDVLTSTRYWKIIEEVARTPLDELCTGQCRHCESLKFLDRLNKIYRGNLESALVEMCGGVKQYNKLMSNPPEHINFL